jgi:hypothetical protein
MKLLPGQREGESDLQIARSLEKKWQLGAWLEFNIAPAGNIQNVVKSGQIIEIEGATGLIAAAGFGPARGGKRSSDRPQPGEKMAAWRLA